MTRSLLKHTLLAAGISLPLIIGSAAHAGSLTYTSASPASQVKVSENGGSSWMTTSTSGFHIDWTAGAGDALSTGKYLALCAELDEVISSTAKYTASIYTPANDNLATLFENYTPSANYSAFQNAVWELTLDTGSGLNLSTGNLRSKNTSPKPGPNNDSTEIAQNYLDSLGALTVDADVTWTFYLLSSDGYWTYDKRGKPKDWIAGAQDLLVGVRSVDTHQVPVPATALLMGAGLLGIAGLRRRARHVR